MKNTFLIGSFLPGYASVFRYNRPRKSGPPSFDDETLSIRFKERSNQFDRRQKDYAFALQGGLLGALLIVILIFSIPFTMDSEFEIATSEQMLVTMEEILQTRQDVTPPPPPRPIIPIAVPDEELVEETELQLDAALDLDEVLVNLPPPAIAEDDSAFDETELFMIVEEMPEMIGGMASLVKAVKYPVMAQKNGIEGNVIVQVVIDEKGMPSDPMVVRSASALLNEAAVKAVLLQRFKPGRQRGRAVRVSIAIPVKFRLTST
jgi:protein TonB